MEAPLALDPAGAPEPDTSARPEGFVVLVEPQDRIHFLDWGGPRRADGAGALLIHGIGQTAWIWTPVARRLRRSRRTVALDLRGHGLSDSPTAGYDPETLADDVVAVADGAGLLTNRGLVLAGHGFGAAVAAWTAAVLGDACRGLVLVDGGWEDVRAGSGLEPEELLRAMDEPPEVLRSMRSFMADREAFDPATWDADQEEAAKATIVETPAGRVVPVTRPHALAGAVGALLEYRPTDVLLRVRAPIVALVGVEDEGGTRGPALTAVQDALEEAGRPSIGVARYPRDGHNLMRYRPAEVTAAILSLGAEAP